MLKLERTSNPSGLILRLREKETFWEPRLVKALLFAFALHLGVFLLFHVSPFKLASTFTFSPVQVQSEQSLQGISALVSSGTYDLEDELPLPPFYFRPPPLDWISFSTKPSITPSALLNPDALRHIEERTWPIWHEPLSLNLEEPLVRLAISGDLAERHLIDTDPLLSKMQPITSLPAAYAHVTYEVQMDERTGKLFWYERTQSSGDSAIDRLTEKILLNIHFDPSGTREFVTGTLNFIVALSPPIATYE